MGDRPEGGPNMDHLTGLKLGQGVAWSSPLRMICVGVISGFGRFLCQPRGFYFLLFDVAVTEAQQRRLPASGVASAEA